MKPTTYILRVKLKQQDYVPPEDCPLCGINNFCGNLSATTNDKCWCADSNVTFSETLLNKVPKNARNKACICKDCALKYAN